MSKSQKAIHASGKRKRAIARVTLTPGEGRITVNHVALSQYGNALNQARITEPVILAGDAAKKYDFTVRTGGGGTTGQADAIRLAIGRALAQTDDRLKQRLLEYDRTLIVADVRRKESAKPNSHGQARAKVQKSYR